MLALAARWKVLHALIAVFLATLPTGRCVKQTFGEFEAPASDSSRFLQQRPLPVQTQDIDASMFTARTVPMQTSSDDKPVKNMLMNLAAFNQRLADESAVADQPHAAPAGGKMMFDTVLPEQLQDPRALSARLPLNYHLHPRRHTKQLLSLKAAAIDRPRAVAGKPDVVNFGLYGKTFYGIDLKEQEFTIDCILTCQWMDTRVITLIPDGQDELTMSPADAADKMWMPRVEITNSVSRKSDLIASSVKITRDGKVTTVERNIAVVKNKLMLMNYPFDEQTLRVNIASIRYQLHELQLAPMTDKAYSGLHKGFFDGEDYSFESVEENIYEDVDGNLKTSRGSMEIHVKRSLQRFQHNFLLPAIIYLAISCAVFWLPFSPTFVTPRVALSIFILLLFSNLAMTADSEIPSGSPYNWIDLICFTIQLHMFLVLCLNIFTEVAYHSMRCTTTALHMSNELKIVSPIIATAAMGCILIASTDPNGSFGLEAMSVLIPLLFFLYFMTYMGCCASTLSAELSKNHEADRKSHEYGGGTTVGPLASSESLAPTPHP